MNPSWNDEEQAAYARFMGYSKGRSAEEVASALADTAVTGMHQRRMEKEKFEKEKEQIRSSLRQMATGLIRLEHILGTSIGKLAEEQNSEDKDRAYEEAYANGEITFEMLHPSQVGSITCHGKKFTTWIVDVPGEGHQLFAEEELNEEVVRYDDDEAKAIDAQIAFFVRKEDNIQQKIKEFRNTIVDFIPVS